jgi:hypothetical protein
MVNGRCGPSKRPWPDSADIIFEDGIASWIAKLCNLFEDSYGCKMFFNDQMAYFGLIWIELAWPMIRGRRTGEGVG